MSKSGAKSQVPDLDPDMLNVQMEISVFTSKLTESIILLHFSTFYFKTTFITIYMIMQRSWGPRHLDLTCLFSLFFPIFLSKAGALTGAISGACYAISNGQFFKRIFINSYNIYFSTEWCMSSEWLQIIATLLKHC